ncbi:MAG: condensation domain-containing protein [Hyphomicrobiales bacterium]|nr:condensation domain-containing protein [Hyphomicrobiales bacterium]
MAMKDALTITDGEATPAFPCTPSQRRYWREHRLERGGAALNVGMRWRLQGAVRDASIERALQSLVARHEILRTGFPEVSGEPVQHIHKTAPLKLSVIDLSRLPPEKRDAEAVTLGENEARRPFDLSNPPLLRATLLRLDESAAILMLTLHHLVVDGWSIGVLIREFGALVEAFEAGRAAQLPEIDLQYADYALWQREMLESGALAPEADYWRKQLRGLPDFTVKPDRPRTPWAGNPGLIRSILLPKPLTDALEARARAESGTLFHSAVATLAAMLRRLTGAEEIVMSTPLAGRSDKALEALVGPVLNTALLRLPAGDDPSFAEFEKRCASVVQYALDHQRIPFEVVVDDVAPDWNHERTPLHSVNFSFQRAYIDSARIADDRYGDVAIVSMPSHSTGALWDLNFYMVGREEGWRLSCEANAALFDPASVEHFLKLWRQTMEAAVAAPHARLSQMAPFDDAGERVERRRSSAANRREAVARAAAQEAERLERRILRIHPQGRLTPIVAINNVAVYYPLARRIGADRPFIDIQILDPDLPRKLPLRAFEDIAADVVRMIRAAQTEGPYILFGLCVHGALAFEAAQQLRRAGETVSLLVMNDTWAPGYRETMPFWDRVQRRWQVRYYNILRDIGKVSRGQKPFAEFLAGFRVVRALRLMALAKRLRLISEIPFETVDIENRWYTDYLLEAQNRYACAPYDGDVVLFRSEEPLKGRLFDRAFGWRPYLRGRVEVHDVPGMHGEMFREAGSAVIAAHLNRILAEIESADGDDVRP